MADQSKLNLELSKDNYLVAKISIDGKYKYIGSRYNMKSYIEKFMESIDDICIDTIFIIFGLGSGEHIKSLKKKYKDNIIIVFEPNKELYEYALINDEFKWIREEASIFLYEYSVNILTDIIRYNILPEKVSAIKIYPCFIYDTIYEDKYCEFLNNIIILKKEKVTDINTKLVFSKIWFKNFLGNLKYICNSDIADSYKGKFKNKPAIIVSAGPSFEKSVHYLKNIKDKMLIFAGGRNLRALINEDIQPHLLSIIDPIEESYEIVKDCISECESPLLFYEGTNTNAVNSHRGDKIIYTQSELVKNIFNKDICNLGYGGSIAHILTKFAIEIGCNPIIFVGQDLAYSNNKLHADSTKTVGKDYNNIQHKMILVEKYGGKGNVQTSESLDRFRRQLEGLINNNKEITFINCSQGGARINGTIEMNLKDAIDKYKGKVEKLTYKDETIDKSKVKHNAMKVLNDGIVKANEVNKLCEEGLRKLDAYRTAYLQNNICKFNKICDELSLIDTQISDIYNCNHLFEKILYPIMLWANKQVYNNERDYKTKLEFINDKRNTKKKLYDSLISTCEYITEELENVNLGIVCENETRKK